MSYSYAKEKPVVFTEEGSRDVLRVLKFAQKMLEQAGAVRAGELMGAAKHVSDTWGLMACIDRLVELEELFEVTDPAKVCWQHRVFIKGQRS